MPVKPIETIYRGYRFRSRLEARWAIFMDAAGIRWEYEPEGFEINGTYYLPDFRLLQTKSFLEIKPGLSSSIEEEDVVKKLAPTLAALANATGADVFLIQGSPCPNDVYDILREHGDTHGFVPYIIIFAPQGGICSARIFECPRCGHVAFRRMIGSWQQCECGGEGESIWELLPRTRRAIIKARQARFEHGE
jgi:hypothetical protein